MSIKRVLILSAGKGTRMGELGEVLPKPLWPLGDTTLLGFQISYWRSLGIEEIFVNIHHQGEVIRKYLEKFTSVKILEEENLLGVGGAVHNLASQKEVDYKGKLLISNVDTIFLNPKILEKLNEQLKENVGVLNLYKTNNSDYKECFVEKDKLIKIDKSNKKDFFTYSGLSLINLEKLKVEKGFSNFFESVCDYKKGNIGAFYSESSEYWDFGTLDRYYNSLYSLISKEETLLKRYLEEKNLFNYIKV